MNATPDSLAIASVQVCTRLDDAQAFDPRIIAIGLVRVSCSEARNVNFDIDAICLDPADPSEENAVTLAKWLLSHPHDPARLISWRTHDPLLAGLQDIVRKVSPELGRDLMAMLENWAAIEAFDLSCPLAEPSMIAMDAVARSRNIDFIGMDGVALERADQTQRSHVRDIVATSAVASWRLWALHTGQQSDAHDAAIGALASWRDQNTIR